MYDILHSKKGNPKMSLLNNKPFLYRHFLLIIAGFTILFFRFQIMNFEGPIFTKIDNPAAFSDSILIKVCTSNFMFFNYMRDVLFITGIFIF